jgi:hypothetical protein
MLDSFLGQMLEAYKSIAWSCGCQMMTCLNFGGQ